MKTKADLDIKAKDVAEIKLEELKADLDREGIPKCPICTKWFPNIDVIRGHIDIIHNGHRDTEHKQPNNIHDKVSETEVPETAPEILKNSDQSGYGTTKNYQVVSVQCKKCDKQLQNNHQLRLHMRKHIRKESQSIKCTNCEYEATDENHYLNHMVDNHSTIHFCLTCNNRFPSKTELIDHAEREHGFTYINSI